MNKNTKFFLLCFMIGEIGSLILMGYFISFTILFHGSIKFIEPNLFILIGEIIGITIGLIVFIGFLVYSFKNIVEVE